MRFDSDRFQVFASTAPQPVAITSGRIVRARTPQDRLDSILKCAEVTTRYVAAIALASFAARVEPAFQSPDALNQFNGNLSFGNFLAVAQAVAGASCDHPLKAGLAGAFKSRGSVPASTDTALVQLLEIRNELGHNLTGMSEAKARAVFETHHPDALLVTALQGLEPVLRHPLFIVERQEQVRRRIIATRLFLMGDSLDPIPEEIELHDWLDRPGEPYLGLSDGALCLFPWLRWDIVMVRANYGMYLLHRVGDGNLTYLTVQDEEDVHNGDSLSAAQNCLHGECVASEPSRLQNGTSFLQEWLPRRRAAERAREARSIPWDQCDDEWIVWYGRKLGNAASLDEAKQVISDRLFDGREQLEPQEVRQVILLLGKEEAVRQLIRRGIVDLRARKSANSRFDDRLESAANVLGSLGLAVEFIGRHTDMDQTDLESLDNTAGSADYIAMREGLINLFVHQDYDDNRTVGQVELTPERAHFFNAGKSLVKDTALFEGGKSTSRNPMLSRALKLIGFAELAGSGLREIERVWTSARRRLPDAKSDSAANTFTLILDWQPLPDNSVDFWRERLGVKLTPLESEVLLLAAEHDGVTVEVVVDQLGVNQDDAEAALRVLERQGLARTEGLIVRAADHIVPLTQEARTWEPSRDA